MATVLVTGANRGIGLSLARIYAQRGDQVLAVCRQSSPELKQLQVEIHDGVDVTDQTALDQLAADLAGRRIDILFNNAGILVYENLEDLEWDNLRLQFEVNALGPLRVTRTLLANLGAGSKVAIISSRVGSLEDNSSGGNYGYRMSKAAVNMAGVNLAHDLKSKEIPLILLHPGFVATDMVDRRGTVEPHVAAQGLIERVDELTLDTTGTFWHAEGYQLPW